MIRLAPYLAALACAAACGGSSPQTCPDAGQACGDACTARFSGNFADDTTSPGNCATLSGSGDVTLAFQIASASLDAPLAVTIDVGSSPAPGSYTSATSAAWSALAIHTVATGGSCVYSAGKEAVPAGRFTLSLAAIDPTAGTAHGTLALEQWVQAQENVDCGPGDQEQVELAF